MRAPLPLMLPSLPLLLPSLPLPLPTLSLLLSSTLPALLAALWLFINFGTHGHVVRSAVSQRDAWRASPPSATSPPNASAWSATPLSGSVAQQPGGQARSPTTTACPCHALG